MQVDSLKNQDSEVFSNSCCTFFAGHCNDKSTKSVDDRSLVLFPAWRWTYRRAFCCKVCEGSLKLRKKYQTAIDFIQYQNQYSVSLEHDAEETQVEASTEYRSSPETRRRTQRRTIERGKMLQ